MNRGFASIGILILIVLSLGIAGGGAYIALNQQEFFQDVLPNGDTAQEEEQSSATATSNADASADSAEVVFKPTAHVDGIEKDPRLVPIDRGASANFSWNVPSVSKCQIDVLRNTRYEWSFDIWGRELPSTGTKISDPIFYKQKYRILCVTDDNKNPLLIDVVEFHPRAATALPTCRLTGVSEAQEGQMVVFQFYQTNAATVAVGNLPPGQMNHQLTAIPFKAKAAAPTITVTVANEVGSATCNATLKVLPATGASLPPPAVDPGVAAASRDSKRVSDMSQLRVALEIYYTTNNAYPSALSSLVPKSLPAIPKDPLDNSGYFYDQLEGGASYELGTNLETNSSALSNDSNSFVAGGTITSEADDKSCNGIAGRYCYNIQL